MVGDVVCANERFKFALEFLEVAAADIGVRVGIQIEYVGRFQGFRWAVDQLWIEYDELRKFEAELREGGEARLHDMSQYLVLHFKRDGGEQRLTIKPPSERQSREGEDIVAHLKIGAGAIQTLHDSLREFPCGGDSVFVGASLQRARRRSAVVHSYRQQELGGHWC